jgi:hypothetical protein
LALIIVLLRVRKKKDVVAESGFEGKKSVFDEDSGSDDFSDIAAPPVDKKG